jgi:hypothetical protein
MADRVDLKFSMSARDLSFLAYAMEFISGGINDKDETIRGYWQEMFQRALDDNFEDAGEDSPDHEYDGIMTTCGDCTDWRLPRLQRVIGYVCACQGKNNILNKVKGIHDHEGTLTVKWKSAPTHEEKEVWTKAWCSVIGDRSDTVEHEPA